MTDEPKQSMEDVVRRDGRYPLEAYAFLQEGLARAVRDVHGEDVAPGARHHVTGQQICMALRDLAIERWGMLARTVLAKWNIHETIDFGNMVYLLIRHNFMHKSAEDSIDDFRDVFDFAQAFENHGEFELKE